MIYLTIVLVILIILICAFYIIFKENPPNYTYEGKIVHQIREGYDFWGLEISFWDRPLGQRKLRIGNLDKEFQIDGLQVVTKFGMWDVTGPGAWNVVIKILEIQKI